MSEVNTTPCKICGGALEKLPYMWDEGKKIFIGEPGIWQCRVHGFGDQIVPVSTIQYRNSNHQLALEWFMENEGRIISWPKPIQVDDEEVLGVKKNCVG